MKKLVLLLVTLALITGCSDKLYVSSDYDKGSDFSKYKTYSWADDMEKPGNQAPMFDNELNRKRVKEAIEAELRLKGFTATQTNPDLMVDFHISINESMEYYVHDYYPPRYSYWSRGDLRTYTVQKGALIIHFVDSDTQQLVWQGVGSKHLPQTVTDDAERMINEAVKAILANYPPSTSR
ncbi:DUF4136 domain-containing protein [Roseivirga sp.]|uniref:DUF4136 domain-containing protein n=1 Tax=Roseivirga sp. TaxID=1964215 RepID=UPI003B51A52C